MHRMKLQFYTRRDLAGDRILKILQNDVPQRITLGLSQKEAAKHLRLDSRRDGKG